MTEYILVTDKDQCLHTHTQCPCTINVHYTPPPTQLPNIKINCVHRLIKLIALDYHQSES